MESVDVVSIDGALTPLTQMRGRSLIQYPGKPAHRVEAELRVVLREWGTHSHWEALRSGELRRARRRLAQHHDPSLTHAQGCPL